MVVLRDFRAVVTVLIQCSFWKENKIYFLKNLIKIKNNKKFNLLLVFKENNKKC